MPGLLAPWPAWSEYATYNSMKASEPDFADAKRAILEEHGADALWQSWLKVCGELERVTNEISNKGSDIIPIFDSTQILQHGFTDEQAQRAKAIGAFVCRATIPGKETTSLYAELKTYLAANEGRIPAWPKESPSMLILYDSPVQNKLRAHPNHIQLQRKLNNLWHDQTGETSLEPLVYLDGVRDRSPGQEFLGLGPHIDAGSLSRWADPVYRRVYHSIFAGHPERFDAYDLSVRKDAKQDLYKAMAHSSVFRSFQGWTALTPTSAGKGTILVYPNVSLVIAYVLLRPFFSPPANSEDIMDPRKWTLDTESDCFPGTFKSESQRLSRTSHPHLRLEECMVPMPPIEPGDTVWWHTDVSPPTTSLFRVTALMTDLSICRYATLSTHAMTEWRMLQ